MLDQTGQVTNNAWNFPKQTTKETTKVVIQTELLFVKSQEKVKWLFCSVLIHVSLSYIRWLHLLCPPPPTHTHTLQNEYSDVWCFTHMYVRASVRRSKACPVDNWRVLRHVHLKLYTAVEHDQLITVMNVSMSNFKVTKRKSAVLKLIYWLCKDDDTYWCEVIRSR